MPLDPTQLAAEINIDPLGLGFAALVASGDDRGIADALNSLAAPGAALVTMSSMTRDQFLTAILPAALVLATKDAPTQAKWDRLIALARSADAIEPAVVTPLVAMAQGDGLLTTDQAAAIGKRTGSRAEVLWGAGTIIAQQDVAFALRGIQ
jgi:hypothetical protein